MSREVRRVPPDWEHPRGDRGRYQPMFDESWFEAMDAWVRDLEYWISGVTVYTYTSTESGRPRAEASPHGQPPTPQRYAEDEGGPPDPRNYMPDWPREDRTHWQMYETTSEGTPISPPCATPEELARWLAENEASAFGGMTATYEQWLSTIRSGYAVSAAVVPGEGLVSGVDLASRMEGGK